MDMQYQEQRMFKHDGALYDHMVVMDEIVSKGLKMDIAIPVIKMLYFLLGFEGERFFDENGYRLFRAGWSTFYSRARYVSNFQSMGVFRHDFSLWIDGIFKLKEVVGES